MRTRSVGSPSSMSRQAPVGGTAKGTNSFESHKGIVTEPELAITASEAQEWIRRNPHARAGVLEALAARGVLVIVPDGLMGAAVPSVRTAVPLQGVRA